MVNVDNRIMYAFEKYLELQHSGELNMVSPEVQTRLGITQEEHRYIMENYHALYEQIKDLKIVDEVLEDAKERVEGKGKNDKSLGFSQALPEKETENG